MEREARGGKFEAAREECKYGGVGAAPLRGLGDAEFETGAEGADDVVAPCAGNDFKVEGAGGGVVGGGGDGRAPRRAAQGGGRATGRSRGNAGALCVGA